MKPSKQAAGKNIKGKSEHIHTVHQRLYHAFNLGTRFGDGKKWKWQWTDIEAQGCVVRSIASFLDCISRDTSCHPLVKDSIADIVGALVWILEHKSEAVLSIAANVVVKLIAIIPNKILQPDMLCLVQPLSSLLSSRQFEVSLSCATALNMILLNPSVKTEKVWEMLVETKTVIQIVNSVREFFGGYMSIEYFLAMASLLSAILQRWPPSRYPVWNDAKLMEVLKLMFAECDYSVKVAILKLYFGIALCGNGAMKLLESGEAFLQVMVLCMGRSYPLSVRMEGFKLTQCLVTNEQGCLKVMRLSCEPIVKSIIAGMSGYTSCLGKVSNDQLLFLKLACRLALIVRWGGEHHNYFWKHGIDKVLLNLLLENYDDGPSRTFMSLEEQISKAREGLKTNFLLSLRSYIWDVLGWLATHCTEDFNPNMDGNELHISILVTCACLSFVDSIRKGYQVCQNDLSDGFRSESVSRAVLMMIYSPCKYIASKSRFILLEILKPTGKDYLKHLLYIQNVISSYKDIMGLPNVLQIIINLEVLTCYTGLPEYQSGLIENKGIQILIDFIRWCLCDNVSVEKLRFSPHFHNTIIERTCCWICKQWEGDDIFLFYGLWGLAELLHSGYSITNDIFADIDCSEALFVTMLQEIGNGASASGLKWYTVYVLCYFGFYGLPCKLGGRIGEVFNDNECADMLLILANGDSLNVHGIVVAIRCPSLLPYENSDFELNEKVSNGSSARYNSEEQYKKSQNEIRLSSHVDKNALINILEFIYMGFISPRRLTKELRILAKHCRLQPLLTMLCRRRPKWGTVFPTYDFTSALTPVGHRFSDFILEAKVSEGSEPILWTCTACSSSMPHVHVHKVVLRASSNYFRAMFQSGMQESHSQTLKVPVSWEAMVKLVNWFYSDSMPGPPSGCLWDNMATEERLKLLQPYMELYWLAELWLLEDVRDICYRKIIYFLDSDRYLSIEIIKTAASSSLWRLAEVAACYLAPLYRQLCHSGDLEMLDERLVDMIRAASVQLSQEEISTT